MLRQSSRLRFIVSLLFAVMFISSASLSLYYLKTDKDNEQISWLITLAIFSFALTLGNIIVMLLRWEKKR